MSGIEELQQRVAEVEQRFGLVNEQRAKYSARLVGLMDAIEARLRDQQSEIERQKNELAEREEQRQRQAAQAEQQAQDNEQLRGMLHSLLQAIEAGGRDVLSETMQALDAKACSLIPGMAATPTAEADQDPEPAPEEPILEAGPLPEPEILVEPEPVSAAVESVGAEDQALMGAIAEAIMGEEPAAVDGPEPDLVEAAEPMAMAAQEEADLTAASDVIDDASADPDLSAIAQAPDSETDAVSLATIMQRVSKMVDEDGALGTASADEANETAPRDSEDRAEVASQQAVSSG